MSFELKLFIGDTVLRSEPDYPQTGEYEFDAEVPYPVIDYNKPIPGTKTHMFIVYAMVDLAAPGYDSHIVKLYNQYQNTDKNETWYFYQYDGNNRVVEDKYGAKMKPAPLREVLDALERDMGTDRYRRNVWASDLLRSMDGRANIEVLLYGH